MLRTPRRWCLAAKPRPADTRPSAPTFIRTLLLIACLLLPAAAGAIVSPQPVAAQAPDRLVLAFYYNWFDQNSWGAGKTSDAPSEPYVSRDRGVMGRHIDQAKAAGIDAFVVNWWGPGNQTDDNFRAMLDEAGARGFRLAVDVDLNSPFLGGAGDVQAKLAALLNGPAKHGAYLRSGGKPVVFFYHQNSRFSTGTWGAIRAAIDPNHESIWIEEGVDVSPLSVFDGHHLYSVTWANRTDMAYTANKFAKLVRAKATALGAPKIYVATAMPGYNDLCLRAQRGGAVYAVDREGGAYYERSWQAAIGATPDWVVIDSFNEWPEGTFIEPSRGGGNLYMDLTAKWAATFHSAAPPPAPAVAAAAPTATAAPTVEPTVAPPAAPTIAPTPRPTVAPTPTSTPRPIVRREGIGPWTKQACLNGEPVAGYFCEVEHD
jgi:hypothetical protein